MTKEYKDIERIDEAGAESKLIKRQLGFDKGADIGGGYKMKYKTAKVDSDEVIAFTPDGGNPSFETVSIDNEVTNDNHAATKKYVDDAVNDVDMSIIRPNLNGFVHPERLTLSFKEIPEQKALLNIKSKREDGTQESKIEYYVKGQVHELAVNTDYTIDIGYSAYNFVFLRDNQYFETVFSWEDADEGWLPILVAYRDTEGKIVSVTPDYHGTTMDTATRHFVNANNGLWIEYGLDSCCVNSLDIDREAGVLVNDDVTFQLSALNRETLYGGEIMPPVLPAVWHMVNTEWGKETFKEFIQPGNDQWLQLISPKVEGDVEGEGTKFQDGSNFHSNGKGGWFLYFAKPDIREQRFFDGMYNHDVLIPLTVSQPYANRYEGLDDSIRKISNHYSRLICDWKVLGLAFIEKGAIVEYLNIGNYELKDLLYGGILEKCLKTSETIPSELEKITESGKTGWRLKGKDADNYADIGDNAVDLSDADSSTSSDYGASGDYSISIGKNCTSLGSYSASIGFKNYAIGDYSLAVGQENEAKGLNSHAEGRENRATGDRAHAEGFRTYANGFASHAEGTGTNAEGKYSHAEGYDSVAEGDYSHAEGLATKATGRCSHANGSNTIAMGDNSLVCGCMNNPKDTDIFQVGIGLSVDDRKNAFEITNIGKVSAPQQTSLISDPTDLITKAYFDANNGNGNGTIDPTLPASLTVTGLLDPTWNGEYTLQGSYYQKGSESKYIGNGHAQAVWVIATSPSTPYYQAVNYATSMQPQYANWIPGNRSAGTATVVPNDGSSSSRVIDTNGDIVTSSIVQADGGFTSQGRFGIGWSNQRERAELQVSALDSGDRLAIMTNGCEQLLLNTNGVVTAPAASTTDISAASGKALVTKEYADANYSGGGGGGAMLTYGFSRISWTNAGLFGPNGSNDLDGECAHLVFRTGTLTQMSYFFEGHNVAGPIKFYLDGALVYTSPSVAGTSYVNGLLNNLNIPVTAGQKMTVKVDGGGQRGQITVVVEG